MKTRIHLLTSIIATVLMTGCANGRGSRIVTNTLTTFGGAFAGNAVGKGKAGATTMGAVAGMFTGEVLGAGVEHARERSFEEGLEQGRGEAAKARYLALVEQQKLGPAVDDLERVSLLTLPLPERRVNGIHFAPATINLRIHE